MLHGLDPDVKEKVLRIADAIVREPAQWIDGMKESIELGVLSRLAGFSSSYAQQVRSRNSIPWEGAIALAAATWHVDQSTVPPARISPLKCYAPPEVQQRFDEILAEYTKGYRKVVKHG
jgi:hypothetical protein